MAKTGFAYSVPKEQSIEWTMHPQKGHLLSAEVVGGSLRNLGRLFKALAKEDEPDIGCFVTGIRMDDDGSIHFDLAILPKKVEAPQ